MWTSESHLICSECESVLMHQINMGKCSYSSLYCIGISRSKVHVSAIITRCFPTKTAQMSLEPRCHKCLKLDWRDAKTQLSVLMKVVVLGTASKYLISCNWGFFSPAGFTSAWFSTVFMLISPFSDRCCHVDTAVIINSHQDRAASPQDKYHHSVWLWTDLHGLSPSCSLYHITCKATF